MWGHLPLIPSTQKAEAARCLECEASLVYIVNSRTAMDGYVESLCLKHKLEGGGKMVRQLRAPEGLGSIPSSYLVTYKHL